MTMELASMIWIAIGAYLAIGLIIGVFFAFFGVGRIDFAAQGASFFFRLIILPGVALLWPAIILRILSFRKINAPIDGHEGGEA